MSTARILAAAREFVSVWESLAGTLTHDYDCTLQCSEAEALAELFRAHGDDATAVAVIEAHAETDEPGDAHYQGDN